MVTTVNFWYFIICHGCAKYGAGLHYPLAPAHHVIDHAHLFLVVPKHHLFLTSGFCKLLCQVSVVIIPHIALSVHVSHSLIHCFVLGLLHK